MEEVVARCKEAVENYATAGLRSKSMEELASMYKDSVENYAKARLELAEAQIAYSKKKHKIRTELYTEKLNGVKYTEESIRSASNEACASESSRYETALAQVEILKERLDFFKTILNQK
ncbi:MAG: hypothetical protein PHI42_07930 [Paludibacteraceae bacterium]|nr:hypothetical protein [Paludibacteraceae bacterium]